MQLLRLFALFAVIAALPACGASAPPIVEAPRVERVAADDDTLTLGHASATVPRGWLAREFDARIEALSPERDVRLVLSESRASDDFVSMARDAWRAFDRAFAREVDAHRAVPVRDGWDAIHVVVYATRPEESRAAQALILVKDRRAFVLLIDATNEGASRRGAQIALLIGSIRTGGVGQDDWAGREARWLDDERLDEFRAFVRRAMSEMRVPGTAIGIVRGDRVYAEGFGVRALGGSDAVTPSTLFMIGSTSKSFLTLLQAKMVDRGLLSWDEPVQALLPSFDLADHEVARALRVRHMVCACTGMPRRDYEMFFHLDRRRPEDFIAELATFSPTTAVGETFQYSNHLVAVGGYATAHRMFPELPVFDAWERALTQEILAPLGMRSTVTRMRDAFAREHAVPHGREIDDDVVAFEPSLERFAELTGACGGMWSNVDDMLRYVRMQLAEGVLPDGERLVSAESYRVREAPGIRITRDVHYGLGLFIDTSHGLHAYGHGGDTLGFASAMDWIREYDLGIVMLSNVAGANELHAILKRRFLELYLGIDSAPTAETLLANYRERIERKHAEWLTAMSEPAARDALRDWLGTYRTDGGMVVALREDGERGEHVVLDEGGWHSRIALHGQRGAPPTLVLIDPPFASMELRRDETSERKTLVLDAGQVVYRFVRDEPR